MTDQAPNSASSVPEVALRLEGVSVHFGGIAALTDITTEIPARQVTAIIGPNGAGKTTMLNAICGLIRSNTTGRISLFGEEVRGRTPAQISRLGLGRSFQDPPLLEKETVLANMLVGAHDHLGYGPLRELLWRRQVRAAEGAVRARAAEVLRFAHLAESANRAVAGLPYGTRKLVDIARALMSEPRLLCLDEPTSGLDADERAVVRDLLLEIGRRKETTVLVVEHHMDLVRVVSSIVIGLQAGTVLAVGTPAEVLDSERFRAAVVGADGPRDRQRRAAEKEAAVQR